MKKNFFYLFHELYLFRNSSILLPFLGSVSQIFLSLIIIWIPKIILDLIENRADLGELFLWIMITGAALLIASAVNAIVHNSIDSCSYVFLFTRLKTKWEEKMMDLDYELFSSHPGKISAEKARYAIVDPNFGVVTYMRRMTELLECLGGLLALSTIIFILHPLILILLFIMFGIELWYGVLIFFRNGCAYAYLVYQYFHGSITIGDFTLYFSAITGLGAFLSKLTKAYSDFMEVDHYVTDFREFMELNTDKKKGEYNIDMLRRPISFTWENVSFSYWQEDAEGQKVEIPVLKKINLTIKAGEKLAIVGENGAGKTTFIKLLCGLLQPKEGRITVNGEDIADFEPEDYRNLFQQYFRNPAFYR